MKVTLKLFTVFCIIFVITAANVYGQKTPVITSGRVNSQGKFSFQYGRLDISVKLPRTANGLWPALWLLGTDYGKVPWPECGEIDLLEMGHFLGIEGGTQEKFFGAAAHWGSPLGEKDHPYYGILRANTYALQYGAFHLLTLIRSPKKISMYLDLDKLPEEQRAHASPYFELEISAELEKYFNKPFFLIINLAAGGHYTGITGKENIQKITALNQGNSNQAAMYIDYVRVWDEQGKLIFNDEFNGTRLDASYWNVEVNDDGGGNQELQSYRRPNVTVGRDRVSGKNCLIITAKRE